MVLLLCRDRGVDAGVDSVESLAVLVVEEDTRGGGAVGGAGSWQQSVVGVEKGGSAILLLV